MGKASNSRAAFLGKAWWYLRLRHQPVPVHVGRLATSVGLGKEHNIFSSCRPNLRHMFTIRGDQSGPCTPTSSPSICTEQVRTYTELTLGADFNMVYGIASTTAAPLAVVPEIHHIWPTTLPKTGIARAPHDAGPYTHSSWRKWENGGSHTHDLNPFAYLTTPASWTLGQREPGSEWRHSPPGASRWRLRGASRCPCPVKSSVVGRRSLVVGLGKFHLPHLQLCFVECCQCRLQCWAVRNYLSRYVCT